MLFKHIYEEGLAQGSYFIGCQAAGLAVVVDPRRDIQVYLEEAQKNGMKIVAVTETHIHADYLSGARELAKATGAKLYLSDEGDENWKYRGLEGFEYQLLKDGDQIKVGNITLTAVHTPGHTPEHLSFLVQDGATASEPGFFLTGDFVFVGDVGRPDLLEEAAGIQGTAEPGARRMFRSLREKFLSLPDYVQVWPGHGAGSACGKGLGAVASTTVGYERRFAWWADYLRRNDEEGFVRALLSGQPEAPYYFAQMKRLNRDGMPILGRLPEPPQLTPEAFRQQLAAGALLVDTRDKLAFAGGHIKGAINIPANKNFSTWAGWLLPYERDLILLAAPERVPELVKQLIRIGLDRVVGFIPGLENYAQGELEVVPQITAAEAKARWEKGELFVLDVRGADEYQAGHIPGALNIHAGRVMRQLSQIPKDRPVVVHCLGGDRSSTAISALMAAGFTNLINLTGGIRAWQQEGFPVEKGPGRVPAAV
ncbi:MAG: rhodanese-like domain-containing protein [Meiothermus sp.]|uniref:MBL fold metallo-hydrolase n=1 Tax=Meiothermus sp. TaxID=1955249 RepID=UPI0025EEAA9D|nr:MBL fold metallo-hydrolase [Meiothermus sp.]MCS7058116.1 rhodanese-like domain-containing protein [Meiothermus sp.]MCS7194361.1 rhodanese-like domain-containing protein [Meiothermus sp.]MCX7740271.1 rhodanese-like domain-containing protein [Meiothermus sp.]MDW8089842.1 rhodanese-like domain-containing protein [Meiothermus sp.]MDW8481731.1 rhodanese-like domain-containing protein [Meiothermus sp.]